MFATLFKQKTLSKKQAKAIAKGLYAGALANTREEVFYKDYGVEDSFDGRFDLLLLHVFLILNRIIDQENSAKISQALFDLIFREMKQTLRQRGIGDVGIPKHMKRMMLAFNGRMHSYQSAGHNTDEMASALARNLYGIKNITGDQDINIAKNMSEFVISNLRNNSDEEIENLIGGNARFINQIPDLRSNNVG